MISQIDLIADISEALARRGHDTGDARHVNAIIKAANIICEEFSRESVHASDGMGLQAWLASDDTGLSSKWMAHVCAGGPAVNNRGAYPHDPSDFGRCYRFLRAVPEARANLHKLRESGPVWAGYVDRWDEMERMYEQELPSGKAPKLYALMREIQGSGYKSGEMPA